MWGVGGWNEEKCRWEQQESSFQKKGRMIKRRGITRELVNHALSVTG